VIKLIFLPKILHGSKINHLKENQVAKVHGNFYLIFKIGNIKGFNIVYKTFPDKPTLFKGNFYIFFDINITNTGASK